ncbi:MAG: hypothetical protein ABI741_01250 [Ferruginibacter sp.]
MCIRKDILATLTYFNIFDYPLKKREIFIFLGHADEGHEFEQALNTLLNEAAVFKVGEFYSLHNNFSLSERRTRGNEKAMLMLKKANKVAALISRFPYVRAVAVSGSLSKNFADDTADIDFFIIAAANRLWIARTFLHLFKKLTFLVNMQHFFCMNYFVDEAAPEIVEKNIYTATEIATLLPLRGNAVFEKFYAANSWTKDFLPNNYMRISSAKEITGAWFKFIVEKLLNNKIGDRLDSFLMKLTDKSWSAKTRRNKRNTRGVLMSLRASKHYSKPDPANFQYKLLQLYENNLSDIFNQYEHSSRLTNELL